MTITKAQSQALRKQAMHDSRIQSLIDVFTRTNSVLLGKRIPIAIHGDGVNMVGAPAWSTRDSISFDRSMFSDLRVETLAKLLGLNYHECCHILYTPEATAIAPRGVHNIKHRGTVVNGSSAYNVLEDQRIETMFAAKYPNAIPYFSQAVYEIILADEHLIPHAWPVCYGRKFLDPEVRALFRKSFGKQHIVTQLEAIIDEYVTLPLHKYGARIPAQVQKRALWLIAEFAWLLMDNNVHAPSNCNTPMTTKGTPLGKDDPVGDSGNGGQQQSEDKSEDDSASKDGSGEGNQEDSDEQGEGQGEGSGDQEADDSGDEGEGNGSGDEAGSDGDGADADGSGSGEGDSDAVSDASADTDSHGNGVGNTSGSIPSPDEVKDALNKALEDAQHDAVNNDVVRDLQNSIQRGSRPDLDRESRLAMGSSTLDGAVKIAASSKRVARELSELRTELEEGWLEDQSSGVLNVNAARKRNANLREAFKTWEDSHIDSTEIEVVIAVDVSSSMMGSRGDLHEAVYVLKSAFDSVGATVTVLAFNTSNHVIYKPEEAAKPIAFGVGGGTNPTDTLGITRRIMNVSKAHTKLFLCLTDGAWGGWDQSIIRELHMLESLGVYRQLFEYRTTNHRFEAYFDGKSPIVDLADFVKVSKELVKQLMKRV